MSTSGQPTCTTRATGRIRTDDPVITSDVLCQLSYGGQSNGAEGNRTPDLSIANAALSQLSYGPEWAREDSNL